MGKLVQIASFVYPWEAHLAQGRLASKGIQAFVFDEGIVTAHPFISNAVGGVKLMVHRSDAERALAVLRAEEDEGPVEQE